MTFELFQPVFCSEQWIQIKRQTRIDPLGPDVNGPKKICLPTDIQAVEGHYRKLKFVIPFAVFESPQSVLTINNFDWIQTFGFPAITGKLIRESNLDNRVSGVRDSDQVFCSYFNTSPFVP
jgi:hypothetical protein